MVAQFLALVALITSALSPAPILLSPVPLSVPIQGEVFAEQSLNLKERHPDAVVNNVFAHNILLALWYFSGESEPFDFTMMLNRIIVKVRLEPGEVWAFHETVLPEFTDLLLKTGWTRYTAKEGYQTALGLPGNGVCHLATLMNWVASEAGLEAISKVNHDFAPVPGVPAEFGTSIRYTPDGSLNSANQNLYLKNNYDFPVEFEFELDGSWLTLRVVRANRTRVF